MSEVTMDDLERVIRTAKYTRRDAGAKTIAAAVYPLLEQHARWAVAEVTRGENLLDRLEALLAAGEVAPGPCWDDPGVVWPSGANPRCELRAGHAGAHECDRGEMGGTAVWLTDATTVPAPTLPERERGE